MSGQLSEPAFVSALVEELAAGWAVGMASVLATRGSMPRHEGARLVVTESGKLLGTVGGGELERLAEARARAVLLGGAADLRPRADGLGPESVRRQPETAGWPDSDGLGPESVRRQPETAAATASLEWMTHEKNEMACGGDALLAVRVLGPQDAPALQVLLAALESGGAAVVEEDWTDPLAPALAVRTDVRLPPRISWDEVARRYVEPVAAPSTCHVFGVGHVGSALLDLLPSLGFRVAAYDDRPDIAAAAAEKYPVTCGSFAAIAAAAPIAPTDSVVVLTHGHAADAEVLVAVLTRPEAPAYVGCIGSRRKAGLVRERLVAAGVSEERAAAVHLPIGEAILAVTPEEIAVSIAAQLVRCRAERRTQQEGSAPC